MLYSRLTARKLSGKNVQALRPGHAAHAHVRERRQGACCSSRTPIWPSRTASRTTSCRTRSTTRPSSSDHLQFKAGHREHRQRHRRRLRCKRRGQDRRRRKRTSRSRSTPRASSPTPSSTPPSSPASPVEDLQGARRRVRRPRQERHVAVDHGREPAQPRHLDEPQHLQHPPALGQDRPAGLRARSRSPASRRPAARPARWARSRTACPPTSWWPTRSTAATPRPSGICPRATSTTSRSPASTRSRSSARCRRATSTSYGRPTTTGRSPMPNLTRFLGRGDKKGVFDTFVVRERGVPDAVHPVRRRRAARGHVGGARRPVRQRASAAPPCSRRPWTRRERPSGTCGCSWRWPSRVLDGEQIDGKDAFDVLFGVIGTTRTPPTSRATSARASRAIWEEYRTFSNPEPQRARRQAINERRGRHVRARS